MSSNYFNLAQQIKSWGLELGFQQVGITDVNLAQAEERLKQWLQQGFHGEMAYMQKHGDKRSRPQALIPGTIRIISVRLDYLPPNARIAETLQKPASAFISRYALGRDYHKLMRKRLAKLTERIQQYLEHESVEANFRVFCDSAPVLEKPLAEKAGLGWMGKHTNIINRQAGSWFFLGTIYTDIPLPIDEASKSHCGNCRACIDICPTQAIVGPYQLDARRCISYLTIELRSSIPVELRPLIGNRIYGCDDCQLICPWNRFAKPTTEQDFHPRHHFDTTTLLELFAWSETEFLYYTEGSAIRRIGYECWLRNIAVALGNTPHDTMIINALQTRLHFPSALVQEHVRWALERQTNYYLNGNLN